jgi:hypothetical protein
MYQTQGSFFHRYWGAATANNAVHEFFDYAGQDGILTPQGKLDVFLDLNGSGGFAIGDAKYTLPNQYLQSLVSNPPYTWLANLAAAFIAKGIPDMMIGVDFVHSDGLKELSYHELAHASHEDAVSAQYWEDLAIAEIIANGHGDQNSFDAGLISVVESWAIHLGHTYTHQKYGNDNSLEFQPNTWQEEIERYWNETTNHIPGGLYNDLIDNGEGETSENEFGGGSLFVTDNVDGFNNFDLFQTLGDEAQNIGQYQNDLDARFPSLRGNSVNAVNDLFSDY